MSMIGLVMGKRFRLQKVLILQTLISLSTPSRTTAQNPIYPHQLPKGENQFSPNGKWLTYTSNESGTQEVYVRPYPESTGGVWKISNGGGTKPVWSPDGGKIYYNWRNAMYSVDVSSGDMFSKGNPTKVFEGNYFIGFNRRFDIHPDGDRFIMIQPQQALQQNQNIFVIMNFFEEIKRLVPVGKD